MPQVLRNTFSAMIEFQLMSRCAQVDQEENEGPAAGRFLA
jgi:hypothetical protein